MLTNAHRLNSVIIFFISLLLFTWGLHSQEIIGFDSRFYLFVQQMLEYGISWFPMTYHQYYPDYPASSTFLIYILTKLFGLNKFTAVLPSAILAALTVSFTYLIGSLNNKHWGWCGAFILMLTVAFIKSARGISLDMYPTAITAIIFYIIYSGDKENKPKRIIWIYPLLFLGFAFRGPIGLVIPTGVMCSYYFINKDYKKLFLNGFLAFLLLCICTLALLGLAYHSGGTAFMHDVLRMQIMGRIDNHFLPRYFYFTNSFGSYALAYPLACLVLVGFFYYLYKHTDFSDDKKLMLQLFGWMMVILIGMSIPDDKKVRYILAMLPAISLIAAYPFVAPLSQNYFLRIRYMLRNIFLFFPLLLISLSIVSWYYLKKQTLPFEIHFLTLMVFLIILQVINVLAVYKNIFIESREKIFIAVSALSFIVTYIILIEPIQLYIDRGREIVQFVESQRAHDHASLVFYKEKPDGLAIKYLINMTSKDKPIFIEDEKTLKKFDGDAYFVTSESFYNELPKNVTDKLSIIVKDTLGHARIIVFVKKKDK